MNYSYSPNREAAMQALREGIGINECVTKFGISAKTVYRYLHQIKVAPPVKSHNDKIVKLKEATHGNVRISFEMPYEDFMKMLQNGLKHG